MKTTNTGAPVADELEVSDMVFKEIADLMFDGKRQFFFDMHDDDGVCAIDMNGIKIVKKVKNNNLEK